jgi:hypothetical protein
LCGNGLHFLPWGVGDCLLLSWAEDAKWLVIGIGPETPIVPIDDDKAKAPQATVVFCGNRRGATDKLIELGATGPVVGAFITAGDGGTATAGYYGTATAGDVGTATAGYYGTATAGDHGTATASYCGTATAGYYGTATAGDGGTATAGDYGTATAGDGGTATAGDYGTATAGNGGTVTAGDGGTILLKRWDSACLRWRFIVGYVGEGGIEAGKKYRLDDAGMIVPAEQD